MAVTLLQVLVLGVIAAADDVPVTWMPSRGSLPCLVPGADRIPVRRPPPPLDGDIAKKPRPGSGHFFWRRDNEELKRISSNGTLELSKRKDSEGVYQCYTTIPRGRVLGYPVNLKFAYLEKQFSVQPTNATAWRGQPHVLTCDISSGPPANISWLRNGLPLPEDRRYILLKNQLLITEVTDEDAGLYMCKATNFQATNKSRFSHGATLVVEGSPGGLEVEFLPVAVEDNVAAPKGSRVVLACPLVGDIKPGIIWEMTVPGESPGELEFVEETLVLSSLEQAGVYTCRVDGRSDLTKTFNVTVTEAASISHEPKPRQVVLASTVRFNCTSSGRPHPNVTWFKDGKELQLTNDINVVISADDMKVPQLLIRGITTKDAGVYQCFARNSVSVASAWAKLEVTGVGAEAPEALRCWPIDADHVYLKWTASVGNHEVIAYTVQHNFQGGKSFVQPLLNTSTSIKVKSPLTTYGFQVRAYIRPKTGTDNTLMTTTASDISTTVDCQGQGVPISLVKVGDDAILVSWQQFHEKNPGVKEWILQYMYENSTDHHQLEKNVTLKGNVYNYTLKVSPQQPVQVRVLGTRSLPWLPQDLDMVPWTSSAAANSPRQPGEVIPTPYNVEVEDLNPHNFTVRWMCRNPKKYQYLVCVKAVIEDIPSCWESYLTTLKVSHLEPATDYQVRVKAKSLGKAVDSMDLHGLFKSGSIMEGEFSPPLPITTPLEDEPEYSYSGDGVEVRWLGDGPRSVVYTQNVTAPLETWTTINTTTENHVQIPVLDPKLQTFLMVSGSGPRRVITINPPPPPEKSSIIYTYIGIAVGVVLLCLVVGAALCIRHRGKTRSRNRTRSPIEGSEIIPELRSVGGRLANGGGSRDAGEPLLNGHVHIIENPSQSKTANGRIHKARYAAAPFDVARYDDADITVETVLDDTTTLDPLDTSRGPEPDRPRDPDPSFNKLPDDNMNSELNRSTFELDNSKIHPTLQPNG